MVAPTGFGPYRFGTSRIGGFAVNHWRKARGFQKAPYNLPLIYDSITGSYRLNTYAGNNYGSPPHDAETVVAANYSSAMETLATNGAYERLKGKIYDQASLGVDFAESRKSLSMITRASTTVLKSFLQVKKLDFVGAAKTLRMGYAPPGVSTRKSAANNWLEYWYGWKPLVSSIYTAVDVVNNPIKSFAPVRGTSFDSDTRYHFQDLGSVLRSWESRRTYRVGQGATVKAITNSAYHTLDQFGLLNPAAVAWELVPFSFVVDWFVNVGDVLQSYSDFAGMELQRTWIFYHFQCIELGSCWLAPGYPPTPGWVNLSFLGTGNFFQRNTQLSGPKLAVSRLRLPSKARAATAISLLIQQFSKR